MKNTIIRAAGVLLAASMIFGGAAATASAAEATSPSTGTTSSTQAAESINREWVLNPANNTELAALGTIQGGSQTFDGLTIDATANGAKFAPRANDTQINAGTIISIPMPAHTNTATITLALSGGTTTITADAGEVSSDNTVIALPAAESARTVNVTFTAQTYLNGIALAEQQPEPEFRGQRHELGLHGNRHRSTGRAGPTDNYQGVAIDARAQGAKFNPRTTAASGGSDTQVNAGTILYIPVAQAEGGATVTVKGQLYGPTLKLDGTDITTGTAVTIATDSTRYVPLSVEGTGSLYLTGIAIDYAAGSPAATSHTVTVGPNGQYRTIQAALDANDSSETDRLVLKITPGDYREKITVTKPGVTFANADVTAKRAVTIRASYYSSNTFDADGKFVPQDEFDLGTNKCATVTIGAGATGFSAYGITFQNDYNVVDHTAAGEQTPAVALNTQADKVYLKNSRIIGRQDTLYVQGAGNRVYVDGGYIEGTVDFVFGDANAYFAGTELHMAAFAGKNNGYFTAANTKKSGVGLVFDRCNLTVAAAYDDDAKLSLGRPWQTFAQYTQVRKGDGSSYVTGVDLGTKNSAYTDTSSAVTYLDSTMSSKITKNRWNVWTSKNQSGKSVDVTFHDDVRFAEYASHDETGALLDPADYKNVVLGSMSALDEAQVQAKRAELLAALGFGSAAGQWVVPDGAWPFAYDPNYSTGTDVQPTQPGGNASPNADSAAKADTMPETGSAIIAVVVVAVPLLVAGLALVAVRRNRQQ